MKIIEPQVIVESLLDPQGIYQALEYFGRVAYKSEGKITLGSAEAFLAKIIKSGHESVLEHINITVRFICDRGVTHELVRHRLVAYTQESTRYVNYQKRGMEVIRPRFWRENVLPDDIAGRHNTLSRWNTWQTAMEQSEVAYNRLLALGASPQEARSVLPNSLKTEIVATANIREWRHILKLRTAKNAHPQMRQVMLMLQDKLNSSLPILFPKEGD